MSRAGVTNFAAKSVLMTLTLTFGLLTHGARSDESAGQRAMLSVDPATGAILVSGGRSEEPDRPGIGTVVKVIEEPVVSQPSPFSSGRTVILPRTRIEIGGHALSGTQSRTIRIIEEPQVSHPPPFAKGGRSVVVPRTRIIIEDEQGRTWAPLRRGEGAESLVEKLNQMDLERGELIAILEALQRAGIYRGEVTYR